MNRRHHGFEEVAIFVVCMLVLIANVIILGVAVSASAETPEQKCEKEYAQYLRSYVNETATPSVPDCKTMTDSQWYAINAKTESLRNEIFASSK